jgi:DNA-binding beta-propeller fold protein YncE
MNAQQNRNRKRVGQLLGVAIALGVLGLVASLPGTLAAGVTAGTTPTKCVVGNGPEFPGYDPVNHYMYVPNSGSSDISVLKGTCTLVGTISLPAGAYPVMAAFDPQNNHMYVTDNLLDQVYDISGTSVVATITGFSAPWGITFDPGDNLMLVANLNWANLTEIRGTANYGSVTVGSGPGFIGYDPYYATLLVSDFVGDAITILNAVNLGYMSTVGGLCQPGQVAFDFYNDYDYITNQCGNNVTVMLGDGLVAGSIGGFKVPDGVAFDQSTLQTWVGNFNNDKVFVLKQSALGISARDLLTKGAKPLGIAYDEYNDDMYVTNFHGNTVYIYT